MKVEIETLKCLCISDSVTSNNVDGGPSCGHFKLHQFIILRIAGAWTAGLTFICSRSMMTPMRYILLVLGVVVSATIGSQYFLFTFLLQISLHYILSFSHEGYGRATSLSNIKEHIAGSNSNIPPYKVPIPDEYYTPDKISSPQGRKANAVIVMLGQCQTTSCMNYIDDIVARNTDLNGIISSMKQMEDRFNKKFHYPYIFLNEVPFEDSFKK